MMAERKVKWGIMGAGWISNKFAADLLHSPNAQIVAVASQSEEKAKKFHSNMALTAHTVTMTSLYRMTK